MEENTEFELPRHSINEECVEEYEEYQDDSGQIYQKKITPPKIEDTGGNPGYVTQKGQNFSLSLLSKQAKVNTYYADGGVKKTRIKAHKSSWVHNLIFLEGKKFDFTGRNYLHPIYNSNSRNILLKTARQVEKSVNINCLITCSDGSLKKAIDIQEGDILCQLDMNTQKIVTGKVTWKSRVYKKDSIKIKTRSGHETVIAKTHPMRKWGKWVEGKDLRVGDYLATTRKAGFFHNEKHYKKEEFEVLAFLIGDGYLPANGKLAQFTQAYGPALDRYLSCLCSLGIKYNILKSNNFCRVNSPTPKIIINEGFIGLKSNNKYIPAFVFKLSKEDTALFLNRLWSTDGHVKRNSKSKYSIEYCSISKKLVRQTQALLWKFGIPSKIRENIPKIYKNTKKKAYILRVETIEGVEIFLRDIGAIGKSEGIGFESEYSNNNRDVIPKEVEEDIQTIYKEGGFNTKKNARRKGTLLGAGLRRTLEYPLSRHKFKRYIEYFNNGDFNTEKVAALESHINEDIYWDKLVSLEEEGEKECVDFTVETQHNFICDGFISHNSTFLANNLAIMCSIKPFYRCLYVSPSHVQTRTFSNDKLKPVLERSPLIARYLQDNKVSTQVFEKGFTNGSFIFLRSAFFSADRARGISSSMLCVDEVQDMIMGNIPVIAQCLSHAEDPSQLFAGTPKSYDNTIQQLWETTTQNEWMVKCTGCNRWNYLDIKNIGKFGPICKKCGKDLDVTQGRWMKAKRDSMWQGFRIPQLMVPWIARKGGEAWKSLVYQMETYPESQFYNEVLGISFDNAAKPVTRADILDCCSENVMFIRDPHNMTPKEANYAKRMTLFAGIDWGEGNDGTGKDIMGKIRTASYTVLTLGGYVGGGRFRIIYSKRYSGKETDPDFIIKDVLNICRKTGVKMIGADWGHGWGMNNKLVRSVGPQRFAQFMYVDNQKEVRKWDPIGFKFQLMRNHVMSEIFFAFKEGNFECPPLDRWEHFAQDMLNISVEYIEYQRKLRYVHRPSDPDDWFHSLVYCKQAADIYHGKR